MARPVSIEIMRHVPLEELNKAAGEYERELQSYAKAKRMHERICFIRMRYKGHSVEEAASATGMTFQSGYNIQRLWNEGGMAALEPRFGGGRTSKLSDGQRSEIRDILSMNPMCTKDVRLFIKERYGIGYSEKQVHVILTKMGLRHAKPYPADHRRPDDAENVLKKTSAMYWMP
jgi:transposase